MTKPAIGRIVHLVGTHADSNGADVAPAIITRVWSDEMINVCVFPDSGTPHNVTSVKLVADEAAARALSDGLPYKQNAAFWPSRV